jgi:hypothetical protein
MREPEKIDENAWGSQTDKGKVSTKSMEEAGALPDRKVRVQISPRAWVVRLLRIAAVVALVSGLVVAGRSVTFQQRGKAVVGELLSFVEGNKATVKNPVLRGEIHRAVAEVKIRDDEAFKALEPLRKASANARSLQAKGPDQDLFYLSVALTQLDIGGTEDEFISKKKHQWKDTILKEVLQSLRAIKDPEACVIALREIATRLWENDEKAQFDKGAEKAQKEKRELAVSLAAQMNNEVPGGRLLGQQYALMLLKDQPVGNLAKVPDDVKEPVDFLTRISYAEFQARKGNFSEALELAKRPGPVALERLEALIGAAGVLVGDRKLEGRIEKAMPFVDEALEIAKSQKYKLPVWQQFQLIRLGARVKDAEAVKELVKNSRVDFQPRAHLEVILAECERAKNPVPLSILEDLEKLDKNSTAYELAWEAIARQHARVGGAAESQSKAKEFEGGRLWPLARTGAVLGNH